MPQKNTLFEIFIFCPKIQLWFPEKIVDFFGWKTRENVVVLDSLAVDNFDFTRKIDKRNLAKNSWKCWRFVKIEFLDKHLTFRIVCQRTWQNRIKRPNDRWLTRAMIYMSSRGSAKINYILIVELVMLESQQYYLGFALAHRLCVPIANALHILFPFESHNTMCSIEIVYF